MNAPPFLRIYLFLLCWGLVGLLVGCQPDEPAAPPRDAAPTPTANSAPSGAAFTDITASVGLDFTHRNGMSGAFYFVEAVGAGGALFDYDNDGDLDLYAVQGHALPPASAASRPRDRLFRNDLEILPNGERRLRFTEVTEASAIRATGYGMGVATGDYNNDGWTDFYVTNWGANQLWRNNGDGTFTDVTAESGTDDPRWSVSATFFDFDLDGWLDLVVVNYVDYALANNRSCSNRNTGRPDYCGPHAYAHVPDRLFRNRGDGTFTDVSEAVGLNTEYGNGLGVISR